MFHLRRDSNEVGGDAAPAVGDGGWKSHARASKRPGRGEACWQGQRDANPRDG